MKLVADLIQSDLGDRLRNLFDSPLLESFNKVLTHPHVLAHLFWRPQLIRFSLLFIMNQQHFLF